MSPQQPLVEQSNNINSEKKSFPTFCTIEIGDLKWYLKPDVKLHESFSAFDKTIGNEKGKISFECGCHLREYHLMIILLV